MGFGHRASQDSQWASAACTLGCVCDTQIPVTRVFRDDLPSLSVSRLRALGSITAEMTRATVGLADVEIEVDLSLKVSERWQLELIPLPVLRRKARTLRLLERGMLCWRCCVSRGVRYRCEPTSVRQRAEHRIAKLRAKLESADLLRLKSHLWGTMERRSRLEAALQRAELIVRHADFVEPKPCKKDKT